MFVALGVLGCSSHPDTGAGGACAANDPGCPVVGGAGGEAASAGGMGGSDAAGSGSGGGGGPVVVHGDCDGLGAVGEFESIAPPGFDPSVGQRQGVVRVVVDPLHTGTIFVGTSNQGLFESSDCGATMKKVNTGRNAGVLDNGILWNLLIDPSDSGTLYVGSLYSSCEGVPDCTSPVGLYKSTNRGVDWDPVFSEEIADNVQSSLQSVAMDPTDPDHLIVTFHEDCNPPYAANCQGESLDGGATWRMFDGPPQLPGWTEAAQPVVFGPTTWIIATPQMGAYYTDDAGATYTELDVPGMNAVTRLSDGTYLAASDYGMWRAVQPSEWEQHPGPNGNPILGDGDRIFVGIRFPWQAEPDEHYWSAPESDPTQWTVVPSTPLEVVEGLGGPVDFAYDADHRVLYSANATLGLSRMVTH
jgi:hypothetical protein